MPQNTAINPVQTPRARATVLRFLLWLVIWLVAFYGLSATPAFRAHAFPAYLRLSAAAGAGALRVLGQPVRADGDMLASPRFAMRIRRGCDGLEAWALFLAAALALPVSIRAKLVAAAISLVMIPALNLVRIVTLFLAGSHRPSMFETLHVDVWQPLFIVVVMAVWLAWAWHATSQSPRE